MPGGSDWLKSLVEALGQSRAILLLMTENSFKSKWVRRELEFADRETSLPILPVILDEFEPPQWFSFQFGQIQRQRFDLSDLDRSATALTTALRKLIANTPAAGSEASKPAPLR